MLNADELSAVLRPHDVGPPEGSELLRPQPRQRPEDQHVREIGRDGPSMRTVLGSMPTFCRAASHEPKKSPA
jgi:hypothetical protein